MKRVFISLLVIPAWSFACVMDRSTAETQFVIDPSLQQIKLESTQDNTKFEVYKCTEDTKYLLINHNSIYYQNDTARIESISGNMLSSKSNCSVKTAQPFQSVDTTTIENLVKKKSDYLQKCSRLVISDARGNKITVHPQSTCSLRSLDDSGSRFETNGSNCLIAISPNSRIYIQSQINPECLQSSYLNQNEIIPQDYESVIKLWPVSESAGKLNVQSPIGARYVRHTVLPQKGFMPRAVKEEQDQMSFISALSTNVSAGNISITSMGKNLVYIQPTFLVENLSKDYCQNGFCAKVAGYVAPISATLTLTQISKTTGRKNQIGEWSHSIKVPGNWSGLAEMKNENNLTGLSEGALKAEMTLKEGDSYILEAKFYEPRSHMDEVNNIQSFFELGDLNITDINSEHLPNLPQIGRLGKLKALPNMPSVGLGQRGVLELMDRFNMKKNWAQKYDRICNSENRKCVKLVGIEKPFVSIKMYFKIGANKQIIPQRVSKESSVFESYDLSVDTFATKICE